jgi:hypothetical protein
LSQLKQNVSYRSKNISVWSRHYLRQSRTLLIFIMQFVCLSVILCLSFCQSVCLSVSVPPTWLDWSCHAYSVFPTAVFACLSFCHAARLHVCHPVRPSIGLSGFLSACRLATIFLLLSHLPVLSVDIRHMSACYLACPSFSFPGLFRGKTYCCLKQI